MEPAGENWVREWKHSALYCCSRLLLLSVFCYVLQNLLCWALFSVLSESQSIQFELMRPTLMSDNLLHGLEVLLNQWFLIVNSINSGTPSSITLQAGEL